MSINASNEITCPAYYDGHLFWESVPPGKYYKLCPEQHFPNFPDSVKAFRTCLDTGEWSGTGENASEYGVTNYDDCINFLNERKEQLLKHYRILNTLQRIGWSLSLTALILGIIIFLYFKKLRVARNYVHINLFISFVLHHVSIIMTDEMVVMDSTETNATAMCKSLTVLSHFSILANYHWLLMEGVYLYSLLSVAVMSERSRLGVCISIGWGGPLVVIVAWILAHRKIDLSEFSLIENCWASITEFKTYWILDVPMMLTVVLNAILFLLILCVIRDKLKTSTSSETKKIIKLARSTMVLIPLFGLYYIVFLVIRESMGYSVELVKVYFELLLGSVQGLLVAVLYCFMNGEVRQEIGRKWRVHKLNRALSSHRSLRDVNSRVSYSNHGGTRNESLSEPVQSNPPNGSVSLRSKLLNFRISALSSPRRDSPGKVTLEINGNLRGSNRVSNDLTENETRIVNISDDYEYNSEDAQALTGLCKTTNVKTSLGLHDENEADETSKLQPDQSGETIV